MKQMIAAVVCSLFIVGTAQAFNGATFIGFSPQSKAIGGTSFAGTDSIADALARNPGNLGQVGRENSHILQTHLEALFVDVEAHNKPEAYKKSKTDYVTSGGFAYKTDLNDHFSIGTGLVSIAGGGADYSESSPETLKLSGINTQLAFAKVPFALSYQKKGHWGIGIAPYLSIAQVAINYSGSQRDPKIDLGKGISLGGRYQMGNFEVGAGWNSRATQTIEKAADFDAFGPDGNNGLDDVKIDIPADVGLGFRYTFSKVRLSLDIRRIFWSDAATWQDLHWSDQDVIALGMEYFLSPKFTLRFGFNHGEGQVAEADSEHGGGVLSVQGHRVYASAISLFSMGGVPSITENHLTGGLGWELSKSSKLDFSVVYGLPAEAHRRGSNLYNAGQALVYDFETKTTGVFLGAGYQLTF